MGGDCASGTASCCQSRRSGPTSAVSCPHDTGQVSWGLGEGWGRSEGLSTQPCRIRAKSTTGTACCQCLCSSTTHRRRPVRLFTRRLLCHADRLRDRPWRPHSRGRPALCRASSWLHCGGHGLAGAARHGAASRPGRHARCKTPGSKDSGPIEELVDRHRLRNAEVRDLLIGYLRRRSAEWTTPRSITSSATWCSISGRSSRTSTPARSTCAWTNRLSRSGSGACWSAPTASPG